MIKFKGKIEDNKYIYSNSIDFDEDGQNRKFCRLKDEFGNWIYVDINSISRFISYDKNGDEIYEDDKILSPEHWITDVKDMVINDDDLTDFVKVKENEHDSKNN